MKNFNYPFIASGFLTLLVAGCIWTHEVNIPIDTTSVTPGSEVTLRGEKLQLTGSSLHVGDPIPATTLVDAFSMKRVDLAQMRGKVLFINIVPSLDTKVCEAQTHYLGDKGARLSPDITRITISRDTPFAQKRFAEEAKLTNIVYLSDYQDGSFGRSTGMLQEKSMLLARGVLVVDRDGIIRYLQVVPELTHLPDMEAAFERAMSLLGGPL